nr:MAG TPA: hypothetical protein [Caudoviricetes sp.]
MPCFNKRGMNELEGTALTYQFALGRAELTYTPKRLKAEIDAIVVVQPSRAVSSAVKRRAE